MNSSYLSKRWLPLVVLGVGLLILSSCTGSEPAHFGIVFLSRRDGNAEIYHMTSDGKNVERLMHSPDYDEQVAAVSPDGSRVIFDRGGVRLEREVYLLDVDTGNVLQLTNALAYDLAGDWSSDGNRIAFISDRDGGAYRLYLMNPDGTGQQRISLSTDVERDIVSVSWSPDSQYLVYGTREHVQAQKVLTPALFIVDLTTLVVTQLTNEKQHGACMWPDWSPDGEWIAMVCTRGVSVGEHGEIFRIHPDGSGFERLTTKPESHKPSLSTPSFLTWVRDPHWSPDGKQIVYTASVDGPFNIYIMESDGSSSRRLTDHNAADWSLSVYRFP